MMFSRQIMLTSGKRVAPWLGWPRQAARGRSDKDSTAKPDTVMHKKPRSNRTN